MLYRGASPARLGRRTATGVAVVAAYVLGGWIVASGLLARAGVYHQDSGEAAPWFGVAFAGTLVALLLATQIPPVSRILADSGTPARLVLPHTFRVVGVSFLIAMAQGDLPAVFALPAGLGDIAIGVSTPFVARRLARERDHKGAMRFNVLGILDLVVALSACGARIDKRLLMWRRSLTLRSEAARRHGGEGCRNRHPQHRIAGTETQTPRPDRDHRASRPSWRSSIANPSPGVEGADTSSRTRTTGRPSTRWPARLDACGRSCRRNLELPRQGPSVPSGVSEAA
jgi:hypothetical protein